MMARAALILVGLLASLVGPWCDVAAADPAEAEGEGRVIEGTIVATGRKPVEGAKVLLRQDRNLAFPESATATTDAQGRYRADLTKFPWSSGAIRAMVLAPGFADDRRTIAAGTEVATADFELRVRPWKEIQVRLEDRSGRPVAGVEMTCSVDRADWSTVKTDSQGFCRIAMAPEMAVRLSAEPEGARPIEAVIHVLKDNPGPIVLPVLPPYRGRVLDPEGRPVPGVAVGRWINFGSNGAGEMSVFDFRRNEDPALTDREGRFQIAPPIKIRADTSRPGPPTMEALCFADASFGRVACQLVEPTRAAEPLEVTLRASRRARVPIAFGSVAAPTKAVLSSIVMVPTRPDDRDGFFLILRNREWQDRPAGSAGGDVLEEALPEGRYWLNVELRDADTGTLLGEAERELVVPGGDGPLNLPRLDLHTPRFRQMAGKPAPEIEATDLDSGRPVRLADFRGKVIVLDIWGYWCGPCIGSMLGLTELHRAYAGRPLVILALHDQSVQSRAEYDRRIAVARRRFWGGRDLPFRVLLDRPEPEKADDDLPEGNGTTIERYGIQGFPALFVIDRDGTLVEEVAEHDRLKSLVRQLVERAEAR